MFFLSPFALISTSPGFGAPSSSFVLFQVPTIGRLVEELHSDGLRIRLKAKGVSIQGHSGLKASRFWVLRLEGLTFQGSGFGLVSWQGSG